MEAKMFCFQCQEAAKGTGCTIKGVCGKDDKTANRMDLLLFVTKGIATVAALLHNAGVETSMQVNHFTTDALFSTITNANFDIESITGRIIKGLKLRNELIAIAKKKISHFLSSTNWYGTAMKAHLKVSRRQSAYSGKQTKTSAR